MTVIYASASGRAGVLGNPTDGYGGSVIACSIRERAHVAVEQHSGPLTVCTASRCVQFRTRDDLELAGDEFDIARGVVRYHEALDLNVRVSFSTSVPRQAGLAGSTALLASLLSALLAYRGVTYTPYYLAEVNRIIEYEVLGIQCGYNDAYMTTFGGLNYMDFRGKEYYRPLEREDYATIERLTPFVGPLPFIVAHTGLEHHSGAFHRPLRERWLEGETAVVEGYQRIAELARWGKRALLERDWFTFGRLMNENWEIQESLAPSGDVNAKMVRVALRNGAIGAKLAGAGGGGTIIALTLEPERTAKALKEAGASHITTLAPDAPGVTVEILPTAVALERVFGTAWREVAASLEVED